MKSDIRPKMEDDPEIVGVFKHIEITTLSPEAFMSSNGILWLEANGPNCSSRWEAVVYYTCSVPSNFRRWTLKLKRIFGVCGDLHRSEEWCWAKWSFQNGTSVEPSNYHWEPTYCEGNVWRSKSREKRAERDSAIWWLIPYELLFSLLYFINITYTNLWSIKNML